MHCTFLEKITRRAKNDVKHWIGFTLLHFKDLSNNNLDKEHLMIEMRTRTRLMLTLAYNLGLISSTSGPLEQITPELDKERLACCTKTINNFIDIAQIIDRFQMRSDRIRFNSKDDEYNNFYTDMQAINTLIGDLEKEKR